ncbi:DNA-3-methyladenine glycosylase 2 family protein [Shewanella maritima]|uniref:DNA-3-methyladenine glycosylase II n=1 Tax=Shewanella maritima TaxID=2520507 RepID=A0A411PKE6_9GAMM|nr:AlkA N-terminal domain-containing protein [Shewanella maritima]QBF83990.1 DNA-3-methyladenine glycosylase 2 family protein [Shewanella maritima]
MSEASSSIEHQCHIAADICQRARLSRDARFDGRFFTGVFSTGIYCRPICPAPAPLEKNVRYFDSPVQAANAGLRPCLRCRPDSAPNSRAWLGTQATFNQAVEFIDQGVMSGDDGISIAQLAEQLAITPRYLNKLFNTHIGTSAKQYALYRQVLFAKQLLVESQLAITDIAFASGFNSIRRFNDAFRNILTLAPSDVRRQAIAEESSGQITLKLSYRPPFAWDYLIGFYRVRQVAGMERVTDDCYRRSFNISGVIGVMTVRHDAAKHRLLLSIELNDPKEISQLMMLVSRIRRMLDVDADMAQIELGLSSYQALGAEVTQGIRIPGVPTAFEAACRAVLGQQVSVTQACKLLNTLVEHYGERVMIQGQSYLLFPTAKRLANASLKMFKMPNSRKQALIALAQFVAEHPDAKVEDWLQVKGIGPWTIAYTQLRGEQQPDVLLSSDLVIKNGLKCYVKKQQSEISAKRYQKFADELAAKVSPWGSYLTLQIWHQSTLNSDKTSAPAHEPRSPTNK